MVGREPTYSEGGKGVLERRRHVRTVERIQALSLLVVSGILFPLTLPSPLFSYGSAPLGAIALVPLYLFVLRSQDTKLLVRGGVLFGAISTIIANFWLAFFQDFSVWTLGGATVGYMAYNAILFGFFSLVRNRPRPYRPVYFALIWVAYEYLKSVGFLGYPWGLAAYSLTDLPVLLQIAEVTGVWGVSLAVVVVNAYLAEALISPTVHERLRYTGAALILPAALLGFGLYADSRERPVEDSLGVLLVQQNVDSWAPGNFSNALLTAQEITREGFDSASAPVDLVVWSETSLRRPYIGWREYYEQNPPEAPFSRFLADLDRPLLTGSPIEGQDGYMNGAILLDPRGEVLSSYGKQQLVPFAERVPFWEWDPLRAFFQRYIGLQAVWVPGNSSEPMLLPRTEGEAVPLGVPICFEDAFSNVVRQMVRSGARGLVNLTNNSWSESDSAQVQHLAAARFRSIEQRIALARSTNSGVTTLVDASGRRQRSLPMFEAGSLYVELPIYAEVGETIYAVAGPWLPGLAIAVTAVLLVGGTKKATRYVPGRLPQPVD